MKFKMKAADDNTPSGWWEEFDKGNVRNLASAQECAEGIVAYFNRTLRPGEKPRRLLEVVFLGKEGEGNARKLQINGHEPHDWQKLSLMTERGGFDRMKCRKCGITGRRYGLGEFNPRPEAPYTAKAFLHCDTARALLTKRSSKTVKV